MWLQKSSPSLSSSIFNWNVIGTHHETRSISILDEIALTKSSCYAEYWRTDGVTNNVPLSASSTLQQPLIPSIDIPCEKLWNRMACLANLFISSMHTMLQCKPLSTVMVTPQISSRYTLMSIMDVLYH